jgi:hypothetical protein
MYVNFFAPDLDSKTNEWISQSERQIYFAENPNITKAPTDEPEISLTPTPKQDQKEIDKLKNQVNNLENKVAKQQQEVNILKSLVDNILNFFKNIFGRK